MKPDLIIFPSEPFSPNRPEPDFQEQIRAAEEAGFAVGLVDTDEGTCRVPGEGRALYRGWMLDYDGYQSMGRLLSRKGVELLTSPEAYLLCHHLPGWYDQLKEETPRSVVFEGAQFSPQTLRDNLGTGSAIVKDYVKSAKHYWDEACFIPSLADEEAVQKVVDRFLEIRGEFLEGGLVFREFLPLLPLGRHAKSGMPLTLEYRLFFFAGRLLASEKYWEDVDYPDIEPPWEHFKKLAGMIESPFFTMDIAYDTDKRWWVMELGDGQVAGLQRVEAGEFYRSLADGQ